MYSILIQEENKRWKYLKNNDGTQYIATTLVAVQEKVKEVLRTEPLENISVVKNCTITESITVTENVTPEPNTDENTDENTDTTEPTE